MHFPTATGRTTASVGLLALALSLASPSLAVASSEIKHASLQGLLLERQEIAEFFAPENHNAPRHAAAAPPSIDSAHAHAHHHRRHSKRGQCMKRPKAAAAVAKGSSSAAPTPSTSELAQHRGQGTATEDNSNNNGDSSPSSSSSKNQVELQPTESSSSSKSEKTKEGKAKPTDGGNVSPIIPNTGNGGSSVLGGVGLYTFVDKQCGKSGATKDVTKIAGPNGAMDFLNCGLDGSGWTPPDVKLSDVLVMELDEALEDPNSPFQACKPFLSIFDKYAKVNDLPAILLASIAMQESTCNPNASGDNGGAYGLMQITGDKCTKGISCSDPDYNVKTGAAYLKSRLDANDGNILLAMGEYNGWYRGLTIAKATAIKDQCCQCQNNVNYHMQMLNGWLLNKNGYELGDWVMGC